MEKKISRYPKMCCYHRTIDINFDVFIKYSWLKHKKRWQNSDRLRKKFIKRLWVYIPKGLYGFFYKWYRNWELKEFAKNCHISEVKDLINADWFKVSYKEHENKMIDVMYAASLKGIIEEEDKRAFDLMNRAA